ncbi:hypothetical protein LIPSTDRAFT_156288 [Lipomyces starkeyi NRRL Y-11557]|uniref:Uncharacterized protein n=1 Tax=Lipomyces starkeyi NRRL Y-11557 TaxID=675824 RepID=A0A1E3PZL1_LIPST|nr:hypothetical protein LIPSTDRAFT_156288 [Lipomyces starkeyi NRRL Y-11557]
MPKTIDQLQRQAEKIKKYLRRRTVSSPSPTNVAVDQMNKCTELAIYRAVILNNQLTQLQDTVQLQKRKREAPRSFITSNTILTGAEDQRHTPSQEQMVQGEKQGTPVLNPTSYNRRCGRCKEIGHNSRTCNWIKNKFFIGYNVIYLRCGLLFRKINRIACFSDPLARLVRWVADHFIVVVIPIICRQYIRKTLLCSTANMLQKYN